MNDTIGTEPPKTILILKSNALTLQSAEQFLKSRGWAVMSTVSLTESVQFLFENKIDYFIICGNHPQKKVKQFPKLFKQFTELQFITYTDMANTPNIAILQEMGVPYQVLPPVSGPAIERVIFRIEKDSKQNKEVNKTNLLNDQKNATERKKVQENIKKFIESAEDDSSIPNLDLAAGTNSPVDGGSMSVETFAEYENRVKFQKQKSYSSKEKDYPYLSEVTPSEKPIVQQKPPPEFERKIENILDTSVKPTETSLPVEKIERAQNCICFKIESTNFRGFLVAAMGKNRKLDEELLMAVQTKLTEVLQQEGAIIDDSKPMDIKIRPVNFEEWAIDKAEFLKKSIHDGNEVAMAFFPINKTSPQFGESVAQDMLSIDIDDLANDVPVSFDVYIHLPANNKYILYTPKNGLFLSSQKERLKAKGIDKMHAKKDTVEEIKKYHAENSLNNSIIDFEQNSLSKKKKA